MCRFVYYQGQPITLSALLTEPENSLIHQSFQARERVEPLNGDGFGMRRPLLRSLSDDAFRLVRGNTDSEHFFALLVDELGACATPVSRAARLAAGLQGALGRFMELAGAAGVQEPLSDDGGWDPVRVGSLVLVDEDLTMSTRPVSA